MQVQILLLLPRLCDPGQIAQLLCALGFSTMRWGWQVSPCRVVAGVK